jgi:cysteine desulfurase
MLGSASMRIYLDYNATAPLAPEAREAMLRVLGEPAGNPSSIHAGGHRARMTVETARAEVARLIGAAADDVVLTGGGTESNNLAIQGAAWTPGLQGRRIVVSAFEHPSVLEVAADLEERGFEIVRVAPRREGVVPAEAVLAAAGPGTVLVSLMLANNEVGTLQPVGAVAGELRRRGVILHTDAAQAAGRIPIRVTDLGVDLLSLAAHKFGGPQGAGALYVRRGLQLRPHLRGGGQELNRRPGTENVAAIAGMGAAAAAAARDLEESGRRQRELRDRMEAAVLAEGLGARVNGGSAPRVPNTSSLAFEGASGEALVIALDLEGIGVSAGAACSAGTVRLSPVLQAMGLETEARCSIRVSLGPGTRGEEIDTFMEALRRVLERLRDGATTGGRAR